MLYLALNETPELGDLVGQRAKPSETLLQRLGVDTRPLPYGPPRAWTRQVEEQDGYLVTYDEWGIGGIIDLFPTGDAEHYAPEGDQAAFAGLLALQAAGYAWFLAGRPWRRPS